MEQAYSVGDGLVFIYLDRIQSKRPSHNVMNSSGTLILEVRQTEGRVSDAGWSLDVAVAGASGEASA